MKTSTGECCTVTMDSNYGNCVCRGFGFVTFSNPAIADVALQYKTKGGPGSTEEGHFIDGKKACVCVCVCVPFIVCHDRWTPRRPSRVDRLPKSNCF